jgi:hypothetical protein
MDNAKTPEQRERTTAHAFSLLVDDVGTCLDDVAMIITHREFHLSHPHGVAVLRDLAKVARAMARLRRRVIKAVDDEE